MTILAWKNNVTLSDIYSIDLTKHASNSTLAVWHEGKQLEIAVKFTHGSEVESDGGRNIGDS